MFLDLAEQYCSIEEAFNTQAQTQNLTICFSIHLQIQVETPCPSSDDLVRQPLVRSCRSSLFECPGCSSVLRRRSQPVQSVCLPSLLSVFPVADQPGGYSELLELVKYVDFFDLI